MAMQSEYEITTLYQEAQIRWLKPPEVLFILQNHERLTLTHTAPQRPTSGSLFLFNRKVLKFFRKDGHQWRRKKDGRAIAEAHERLKVGNVDALNCYYAHGEHSPTFQRRIYWMLDPEYEHIVLVHYRDVINLKEVTSPISHSCSGSGITDDEKFEAADVGCRDPFEELKAFFEFLKNSKPPRSLSDCTANDAVEFLRRMPSDKVEAVVRSVSGDTFKRILGSHNENPFDSQIVRTFLMELAEEQTSQKEFFKNMLSHHTKEDLFEMRLKTNDVDNVDSLIITDEDARNYFPFTNFQGGTESLIRFEDQDGKGWLFGYSYHNIGSQCEFTRGWSRYVKENQLSVGDSVFFQRHRMDSSKFFIGCRRHNAGAAPASSSQSAALNPTSPATSKMKLELREKLKEVEIPFQQGLPEHSITGSDPILVISCGKNQDSEETYFISCIYNELCRRGFTTCSYDLDRSTMTGDPDTLYRSRVCIMIITMNYARSRECLAKFTVIMGHLEAINLALLPVFFNVIPGSFENSVHAFEVHKWRKAMNKLFVYNGKQYIKGDECMLAKIIVRDVSLLIGFEAGRNLIGIKLLLGSILPLIHCHQPSAPQIVGLWGMAGIGKTAITREIYRTQAQRYDLSYFLPDLHLMCQTKGLSHLRDDFFSKIFGEERVFIDTYDTKISFTRNRFLDKKILIVLDGVSNVRDAEVVVGGFGWFSGGHTIILTSRNRQVLVQCKANELYEIPKLSEYESYCLCCQFATEQKWKARRSLISEVLNYASGIPLALRVLCSALQKQCINDEKQHLRRLRQHPPIEIQDAFRNSFNELHDNEKDIFLDLACFFRGENKDYVVKILDGCGFFTDLGVHALIDESLISLVDNKLEMPNFFQDMGRFVVCQEYEAAGKRTRLWDSNDIADVLTNKTGTEAIEGIFLDMSGLSFELSPAVFERMHRLRLLKIHCPTSENDCKVCLREGLYSLSDELRLLHWERYPLGSLPRNFNPKNLVELNMPYSNMTKLWKGTKNLEKLNRIILSHSRQLNKFPRLSKAKNLEHIDLEGCTSLVKVNSSILHHHKLTFLSLKDCSHLRIMPATVHLESLEVLNLSGCSDLEDLHDFSPNLKELYLAGTAIREMPPSIDELTRLVTLDLENCKRLQHLPPGISNLKVIVTLKLSGCSNLRNLPIPDTFFLRDSQRLQRKITTEEYVPLKLHSAMQESRDVVEEILSAFEYLSSKGIPQESWPWVTITPLPSSILHSLASRLNALVTLFLCKSYLVDITDELCRLTSLKALDLGGNSFSQIPESIKELRKLHNLRLRHCKNLTSLPELPSSLKFLNAHGCVALKSISLEQFPRHYTFSNCFALSPEVFRKYMKRALDSVEVMAKGHQQEHNNPLAFSICIPAYAGHEFSFNFRAGSSVMIELTPGMLRSLSGFTLSVVVEFRDNYRNVAGFGIKCICRKARRDLSPRLERIFHCWAPKEAPTVRKDHMFVFGNAKMHPADGIDHDFLAGWLTFEFHPVNWKNKLLDDSCTVKRCAVYLITTTTCDKTHGAKRPSSMNLEEISSVEHLAPPYKRCRLKRVIESVILNLRKRKRENSVSDKKNISHTRPSINPKQV
ncbi:PREDICTED: disease resistance protein RRS1-like isoform X1 [Camelina sativa]|uniref:Disease resistance protein RRS1-like isoform X1 n=2 Tax=Camelina sativa TaxID=90675 RepID=A0ABM0V1B5_CAMSA|nr:PREDICTED: disease resistance protein RRS1-like isoform X1 [Camelina sativa]XP_010449345.1 PREDICTED: disease resistance protein RRS1-like isoform X1 [Camelina sativa]